jgi:hypothetical protein
MTTPKLILAALAAACTLSAATLSFAQPQPFVISPERVKQGWGMDLGGTKTIFIPTVILKVSVMGDFSAKKQSGMFSRKNASAQAHGQFYVKGLEKPLAQDLAAKVQADLVKRLRDSGYTVLTWDDLKDDPFLAAYARQKPEETWNMPLATGKPLSWVAATPTDAQAFETAGLTTIGFRMQSLAREKNFVIMVPEISYAVPQMWGETSSGYSRVEAGINIDPAMKLFWVNVWGANPKGGQAWMMVQDHGGRPASEKAGNFEKMSGSNMQISKSWTSSASDFLFTLDTQAFSDGVLRVGYAVNEYIVAEVNKAAK